MEKDNITEKAKFVIAHFFSHAAKKFIKVIYDRYVEMKSRKGKRKLFTFSQKENRQKCVLKTDDHLYAVPAIVHSISEQ